MRIDENKVMRLIIGEELPPRCLPDYAHSCSSRRYADGITLNNFGIVPLRNC